MKSTLVIAALILVTNALFVTVVQAQKTSASYDQSANFSNYKTFTFSEKSMARNPYVNQMIRTAVERELTARGLSKVDANADLLVSYLANTGFDVQIQDVPMGHVVNPVNRGMLPTGSQMLSITTGTLLIDISDKTDNIVFRGTAKDVLERAPSIDLERDAKMVSKPVNKGIAKIFKKYPAVAR